MDVTFRDQFFHLASVEISAFEDWQTQEQEHKTIFAPLGPKNPTIMLLLSAYRGKYSELVPQGI